MQEISIFLSQYLKEMSPKNVEIYEGVFSILKKFSLIGIKIKKEINTANLKFLSQNTGQINKDGDFTKNLDKIADNIILKQLKNTEVKYYASEENEQILSINEDGKYAVSTDPLDGSSNIFVNSPIGTIFCILKAKQNKNASLLQTGTKVLASGYILYGPQTFFIFSFGKGTHIFKLNEKNEFILQSKSILISPDSDEFAINVSNYNYWNKNIRQYINNILDSKKSKRKKYNMRWVGSLVSDTFRIILRGGIFLYPNDSRLGYENGRLRLIYEAIPIAFIIENAKGIATDGNKSILKIKPKSLHQRIPLIFGSKNEVEYFLSNYA